ncbi:hypothetical protein [Granulicella sp. dw_53]|uniref:hypothetical protein n=1 Tax=Granulicella sp. dw_53 TaxID=2719792 RepID=UPI001BD3DC7E|nr:hypothetical protein [Granulicella sp. dw_53]
MRISVRLLRRSCPLATSSSIPTRETSREFSLCDGIQHKLFALFGLAFLVQAFIYEPKMHCQTANMDAVRSDDAIAFLQNSLHAMNDHNISNGNFTCSVRGVISRSNQSTTPVAQWSETLQQNLRQSVNATTGQESVASATAVSANALQVGISNTNLDAWMHFPQYAISRLSLDPSFSLKLQRLKDGSAVLTAIRTLRGIEITQTRQIWYFSVSTFLPTKVVYFLSNPKNNRFTIQKSIEYGGFEELGRMQLPKQYVTHTPSIADKTTTISGVECALFSENSK